MLDRWVSFALIAAVVSSLLSIVVSEIFFGIAILLWVVDCVQSREFRLKSPPFTPFLLAFFVAVLIAIAFSTDMGASLPYLKKFIKFLCMGSHRGCCHQTLRLHALFPGSRSGGTLYSH